jgi:hypothetical protein
MEANGQLYDPAALATVKQPPVPIVYETGWAPEPVSLLHDSQTRETVKYGHEDSEPRMAVLTRTSRNLLDTNQSLSRLYGEEKISCPSREWKPRRPARSCAGTPAILTEVFVVFLSLSR